jgi:guanylate kinase
MSMILTLTGASGAGKTSIAKQLINRDASFRMLTSCTTRDQRSTDLPGEYEYLSDAELDALLAKKAFQWTAEYAGKRYGTKTETLRSAMDDAAHFSLMILVPDGMKGLYDFATTENRLPHIRSFFIRPADEATLRTRLKERGDTDDDIARRMSATTEWSTWAASSGIPFHYIDDQNDLNAKIASVMRGLGTS